MVQLSLFEDYKLPHLKRWDDYYKGWRPKKGSIGRISGLYWQFTEENKERDTMQSSLNMMTGYIMDVTDAYVEIILPFLSDTPWCVQEHLIAPLGSIEPEISYGFDEAKWRQKNPISHF